MRRGKIVTLTLTVAVLFGLAFTAWAAMPPPPVNQNLGISDTTFINLQEADCRICHNQNPPAPYPVDPTYLPDRHHLNVGQTIPPVSDVPKPDADGDGVPDVTYDCLNCHNIEFDPVLGSYVIVQDFRDCTTCHIQNAGVSTVHHRATEALEGNCQFCHGGFVDRGLFDINPVDGVAETVNAPWLPTYQPGLVTPWPSRKDIAGTCDITQTQVCVVTGDCPIDPATGTNEACIPNGTPDMVDHYGTCSVTTTTICREGGDCPVGETCNWPDGIADESSAGTYAGNCNYCHNNATGSPGGPTIEDTGPFAPVLVFRNDETHHSTDFFGFSGTGTQPASLCFWCHDIIPPSSNVSIRTCGNCHGIPSLHNIQFATQPFGFPSDGTVVPGEETPWAGHIGNQIDCNGCHGFDNVTVTRDLVPQSGPVVPGLYTTSASSVESGASVELGGTGFVNLIQNPMTGEYDITLGSDVLLVGADGSETVIAPDSVAGDTLNVTLAGVPAGSYKLAAKKASRNSNKLNIVVTPTVTVGPITCADGATSISGSGFASYLDAADSSTSVTGDVTTGGGTDCSVYSNKGTCNEQPDCSWNKKARVCEGGGGGPVTTNETAQINSWIDTQIEAQFSACPDDGTVVVTTVWDITGSVDPPADPEVCDDGIDNDGDGDVDCADADCAGDPICDDPPAGQCSDYTDKASCNADPNCHWNKKKGCLDG